MSEEDKKWSQLPLTELRVVAKKYKQFHSLGNISKAKKDDLITTLKKFMMFEGDAIKQKPDATPIATTGTKEAPEPKAKKAKVPAPPPAPSVMGDKGYKKGVVAKKVVQARGASADAKSIAEQAWGQKFREQLVKDIEQRVRGRKTMSRAKQLEGASADAKKIAEQAKAMGHSIAEHKKMLEKEKQVQTKGKAQARKAIGDAMSIAEQAKMMMKEEEKKKTEASSAEASSAEAPKKETMEEFKKRVAEENKKNVEEAKARGEKYIPPTRLESLSAETKQKVNVLLKVPKVRLKEGIKKIAEKMGAKLPRGILTTPMYSDKMKEQLPTYALGGRNDKDQRLMLEDAIGRNGMNLSPRSREEFMNKLFDLILSQASSAK